jgi:protein-S-isoprenylcysteine O-methyltransferase Ste14
MNLVPDFDLGLWNAWLVLVVYYVGSFLPFFIDSKTADARMEGEPDLDEAGSGIRIAAIVDHAILMPLTFFCSLFVPLESGTFWLTAGLLLCAVATVMAAAGSFAFATKPLDEPMTDGVYAISRHPMYVSRVLVFFGIGLAAPSWVFLLCAAVDFTVWRLAVPEEEQNMVAKYGASYEQYMRRTPRWIGLPRSGAPMGAT